MKKWLTLLLSSIAVLPALAHAQTIGSQAAGGGTTTAPDQGVSTDGIQDIVVTAQRQAESSQRAAIAISVLQPASLAGVTQPENISKLAPALQMGNIGGTNPLIYIRGVGTFSANSYTDSAVAINYDGVYLARPSSTFGLFYDLARVEILKGPQGTLYGRNATGGALNIIPATPSLDKTSGTATVGYGNYDTVKAEAAVNVPLSSTVAVRVAGTSYTHGAYNTDGTYTEKGAGVRAQLLFKPSDSLSIRISGDYFDMGGTGPTAVLLGSVNPVTGAATPYNLPKNVGLYDPRSVAIFNSTFVGPSGTTQGALAARPFIDNQYYGALAEINADLGFADLTVLGAWRRNNQHNITALASFISITDEKDEQFSTEVRLAGKLGPVDWLAGGYYFNETGDTDYTVHENLFAPVQTLLAKNKSYAGFGRLTWHVSDAFRLTGSARYTQDKRSFVGLSSVVLAVCQPAALGCANTRRLPLDMTNIPAALASIGYIQPPGVPVYIDATGTSDSIYVVSPIPVNDRISPSKVTYRAAAEFEPRAGSLLYASVETGYRAGGFSFSTFRPTFDPETITAYTIGSKNRFLNNKLQLNVEAFLWKYKNQQISHSALSAVGGIEFITENVGASTNKGFEVEVVAKPLSNTTLHADVQYLHARNKNFVFTEIDSSGSAGLPAGTILPGTFCPYSVNPGASTYTVNCSGFRALRSPTWTMNLGVQQIVPLSDSLELQLEANTHYQTKNIVMFERRPFSVQGAYWMSDASVTLASTDDTWSASLYVSNIENNRIQNNAFFNSLTSVISGNFGPPRTYGGRLRFNF